MGKSASDSGGLRPDRITDEVASDKFRAGGLCLHWLSALAVDLRPVAQASRSLGACGTVRLVIIAAHNEEANLPAKLSNLRLLDYPGDRLEIVIASDGSTDRTADILSEAGSQIVPVFFY